MREAPGELEDRSAATLVGGGALLVIAPFREVRTLGSELAAATSGEVCSGVISGETTEAISGTTMAGGGDSVTVDGMVATTTGTGSAASCAIDGDEAIARAIAIALPAGRTMFDAFFIRGQ